MVNRGKPISSQLFERHIYIKGPLNHSHPDPSANHENVPKDVMTWHGRRVKLERVDTRPQTEVLVSTERWYPHCFLPCCLVGAQRRAAADRARSALQSLIYDEEVLAPRTQD